MVTQLLVARGMPKASQADARYTPAGGRERCGGCRHFMAPSVCNRILGPVTAVGWCRYYSQKPPQRAANFPGMGPSGMSLDLNFMQPGLLDPRITFTRASGGTYFDRNGVMQNAAVNLLLQSANLAIAPWTLGGAGSAPTVTANQATAPDGTLTAARIALSVTSGAAASFVYQIPPTSTVNPYVFSVYLRGSVGGEQIYLFTTPDAVSYFRQPITLSLAWQRFSLITPSLTATNWFFALGVDLRDGGQSSKPAQTIYAWGAQLELGSTASPYIPTTTAANGAPRWDYNPSTLALNGLLLEEARTNLCLWSGDLSHATWGGQGSGGPIGPVATGNAAVAPDGTTTATRLVYPAVSGASALSEWVQTIAIGAGSYVGSMWLKGSVGGEQIYLMSDNDVAAWNRTLAVLSTSWQRFTVVIPSYPAGNLYFQLGVDLRDAGQSSKPAQTIYAWGAQVEQGAFPTSYIPTTGAAVTRAQDVCTIPPASMGWFTSPGGSWQTEFIGTDASATNPRLIAQANTSGSIGPIFLGGNLGGTFDGVGILQTANATVPGTVSKVASTWSVGQAKVCANARAIAQSATLTTGFGAIVASGIQFMVPAGGAAAERMSGWLRRVSYWPRVLTNAEMQAVTT